MTAVGAPELGSDKAARIVEAMRASVAARGFAGSTFDHVAREAGVSRGLLHYHFATKERLLLEAVRRESELRQAEVEAAVAPATSAEEVLAALVTSFEDFLGSGPSRAVMFFEVLTLAQRNPEIAGELAELGRRIRGHIAEVLRDKATAGVLSPAFDPEAVAAMLFVLVDGIVVRRLSEPDFEIGPLMERAVAVARSLLV
jgi:AcrR family transcriptional regulator